MSDRMKPQDITGFYRWIVREHEKERSIFGIPQEKFYRNNGNNSCFTVWGTRLETPFGPASGPHTQLARNIVSSYLCGARYIELKTVQALDDLKIEKPCIDARDEGYNTEWSQELSLEESYEEYVKAWIVIHLLKHKLGLPENGDGPGFAFNMSVGYDLEGIKGEKIDRFIERMRRPDADIDRYSAILGEHFPDTSGVAVSCDMVHSVTISTMHGCPPAGIEEIAKHLMKEKGFDTFVKLNPTLLGVKKVRAILESLGYGYIALDDETFEKDLGWDDAVALIGRLLAFAKEEGVRFGVKLSNTLANKNTGGMLPGGERYMSGRALFPVTARLAYEVSDAFRGRLAVSYCGGASVHNIHALLDAGIFPVTMATELLKPGGYLRLYQLAMSLQERAPRRFNEDAVDTGLLEKIVSESMEKPFYKKRFRGYHSLKDDTPLGWFDCIQAPCTARCPIGQDVPGYMERIEQNDPDGAMAVILQDNPLPHITGHICDHGCMSRCVRWEYDNPIGIRAVKRYAALHGNADRALIAAPAPAANRKKKIAVIGGGPAGLASSYFLARTGFFVTLFEREKQPGGTVRKSIPRFRLPDKIIDRDIGILKHAGVFFETGCSERFCIDTLFGSGFQYVILALGAQKPKVLDLGQGDDTAGFYTGIDFLDRVKKGAPPQVGERVLVVGGGNSAVDAARAAKRLGPRSVKPSVEIVYRRDLSSMPADREEIDACIEEGIVIRELLGPVRLRIDERTVHGLECAPMRLGKTDKSGRKAPVPKKQTPLFLRADTVILAIGEKTPTDIIEENKIPLTREGRIEVDPETLETGVSAVYAAGDCVRGPATVVEAIADAKTVSAAITAREKSENTAAPFFTEDHTYRAAPPEKIREHNGRHTDVLPFEPEKKLAPDRRGGFETVIQTLGGEDARKESERCLQCSSLCNRCVETCPNRANVAIGFDSVRISVPVLKEGVVHAGTLTVRQTIQILHLDRFCNECGNCETFCPHSGGPYKKKLTLFSDKESFESSENSGFLPDGEKEDVKRFLCRAADIRFSLGMNGEQLWFSLFSGGDTPPSLLFSVRDRKNPELLSSNGVQTLDTAPLISVWLVCDAVLRNMPWLLTG
ncbi:MAG: putative selenate reductase subunit YgfK [Spirochaetes bacterium]|nr:putative selenate reductase subunit YgfK [Spirochaetota bacterium]